MDKKKIPIIIGDKEIRKEILSTATETGNLVRKLRTKSYTGRF
jgi:hypothetical protein